MTDQAVHPLLQRFLLPHQGVEIGFGASKDAANQRKHGLLLAEAERMDFDTAVYVRDDRFDYGENRIQALGLIGRLHMLVFTIRGDMLRAISPRKANPMEVERYATTT